MAISAGGPIKVGSGYVDVFLKIDQKTKAEFRKTLVSTLEKTGLEAGKAFAKAAGKGFETLPTEVKKAAKKTSAAVEKEAKDTKSALARIEAAITKEYGKEAAKRFKEARQLEQEKRSLVEGTSAATRTAIKATVQAEERAARDAATRWQTSERSRIRLIQQREREAVQAERAATAEARRELAAQAAAQRQAEAERRAEIRRTAVAQQAAARASLRTQLDAATAIAATNRQQIQSHRRLITQVTRPTTDAVNKWTKAFEGGAEGLHKVGTNAVEAGNLVRDKLLAPLALVSAAITTIGVKSADMMIQSQTGLKGMGVNTPDINEMLKEMTQYGIATPYSVNDMLMYGTRYVRANASHSEDFNSSNPARQSKGSHAVTQRANDMVKMIGDSAAFGGITDPNMVSQGLYALEVIQDMGRAPLRNVKQLERATGIPAQNIAQLMGFRDRPYTASELKKMRASDKKRGVSRTLPTDYEASAQLMDFMANAKETGGLSGEQLIDALLRHWEDPESGIKGSAARMGSATISGRIQQMQEGAQYRLGQLFYKEGKDGTFEYTGLGEKIMGKKTPQYSYDRKGEKTLDGYTYEGGYLQQIQEEGKKLLPGLVKLTEVSFEVADTFMEMIAWITDFGKSHSSWAKFALTVAKWVAIVTPFLIAIGLFTKLLGKFGKMITPVVSGGARAARGATRVARQVNTGLASRQAGGTFREGYRTRRQTLRNGDDRSIARRTVDSVTGQNSQVDRLRQEIQRLEDEIKDTNDRSAELRRSIRALDGEHLNQLIRQLSGSGDSSVSGASRQAANSVSDVRTEVRQANSASLAAIRDQLQETYAKADTLTRKLRDSEQQIKALDSRKLGSLREQQVKTTTNQVEKLAGAIRSAETAVKDLNKKSLTALRKHFTDTTSAVNKTTKAVKSLSDAVNTLKAKSLKALRDWFDKVTSAANKASKTIGTKGGTSSLNGRVSTLSKQSLTGLNKSMDTLGDRLSRAKKEASELNTQLGNISKHGGGSSSGGSKKSKKKKARGGVMKASDVDSVGVLPGYSPWVDSIPAVLSPGEAVLRPEVTQAIGPGTINAWNAMAVRGQISRYARGGVAGKLGLDQIREWMDFTNVGPLVSSAFQTMTMDSTSNALGGDIQSGIIGTGTDAAHYEGSAFSGKTRQGYDFFTDDIWKLLRRVPTIIGQAAGVVGGTFAPVSKEYFWDDVWKGSGNIYDRGRKYLGDLFSWKTVKGVGSNLWNGLRESAGSLWTIGKTLVTDPMSLVQDSVSGIWSAVQDSYNNYAGMFKSVKSVIDSPKEYAKQVAGDFMDTAKENMPNTKGLFDFDKTDKLSGKMPNGKALDAAGSTPGGGGNVERWRPVVLNALSSLGLSSKYADLVLHRIQVESGGNPLAVNNWDINARNGTPSKGLMQTIQPTFDRYAGLYKGMGIFNPLANIYAGLNYARHRYNSGWTKALSGNAGYWMGTKSAARGSRVVGENGREIVDFQGGERVYNNAETEALLNGKKYEIHVHEARNEPTPQAVMRALRQAEALFTKF
ncbi:putative ORF9 [Streptomyces sp. Tu6071]|uniref:transglycosylase SLT domain-containing protein n=1 Tax=Streptomyces sp. Tu6071 TaxID=355249 RepID=UPI00020E5453|nr:transglycosylase SLT domain-containing protein [Streptomyces sp. Tu6071]EGJ73593.1 putative ORF9 [Streptomyces sp. Tu6071]